MSDNGEETKQPTVSELLAAQASGGAYIQAIHIMKLPSPFLRSKWIVY